MWVIVAAILLSVILRYPLIGHERFQADSYYIHTLAQAIIDDGRAVWTFSPLSYVGYYPLSYPSGMPFLLAEISQLTGMTVESSILIGGMAFGVLSCLAIFCIAREFLSRPEMIVLVLILAALAPRFVDTTYWTASARGPAAVLLLLVLLISMRAGTTSRNVLVACALIFVIGCASMHHLAIVLVAFAAAYLLSSFGVKHIFPPGKQQRRRRYLAFSSSLLFMALVFAYVLLSYVGSSSGLGLGESRLFDVEQKTISILLNLGVSYSNQIGLVIFFSVAGVAHLLSKRNPRAVDLFPVAVVVCMIPLLGQSLYIALVLMPFVVILGAHGVTFMFGLIDTRLSRLIVTALVVSSILLVPLSIQRWNSSEYVSTDTVAVDDSVFNDGNYMLIMLSDSEMISNAQVLSSQIAALSGATLLKSGIYSVLSGDIREVDVSDNVTWSDAPFPIVLYVWFSYDADQTISNSLNLLMMIGVEYLDGSGMSSLLARDYFLAHSKLVVLVDNKWPGDLVTNYGVVGATFPDQVGDAQSSDDSSEVAGEPVASYLLYRSERSSFYAVDLFP